MVRRFCHDGKGCVFFDMMQQLATVCVASKKPSEWGRALGGSRGRAQIEMHDGAVDAGVGVFRRLRLGDQIGKGGGIFRHVEDPLSKPTLAVLHRFGLCGRR